MNVAFPYHVDDRKRTAEAAEDRHVRDMIEQLLLTSPGERVNRPTFGCGVLQMVFAPSGPQLAGAARLLIQSALQQWLGEVVQIDDVDIAADGAETRIVVRYVVRRTGQAHTTRVSRALP